MGLHPAIGVLVYPRLWEGSVALAEFARFERWLSGRLDDEPDDREAAVFMRRLSGRDHVVVTGVAVLSQGRGVDLWAKEETRVLFRNLTDNEIERYVDDPKPEEKPRIIGIVKEIKARIGPYKGFVPVLVDTLTKLDAWLEQQP